MKFIRRDPDAAYMDGWLWLPKSRWDELFLKSNLIYANPRSDEAVVAYHSEPHHWRVPRNFISAAGLAKLPYPVHDARFRSFPHIDLRSSVVLDAKEPDKDYQTKGSTALLQVRDGILSLRCGAGKSPVGLHCAAQLRVPLLILINDKGLARQWAGEIEKFLGIARDDIGRCFGGKFDWQRSVTIATVQTIARRVRDGTLPVDMTHHFGVVLIDEAHVTGAPYFNLAVPPFQGRRWGLSATPAREDEFDPLLRYTVGHVVYSYLMPNLRPFVIFKQLGTRLDLTDDEVFDATHDVSGEMHNMRLFGHLSTLHKRTDTIAKDIRDTIATGRKALVLSHSRNMVEELGRRFKKEGGGVTHGDVKENEHERVLRECNPVIAIMQRGKQALNKPDLDTLFVCEPFTKRGVLQQTMGRILRLSPDKHKPVVIFYEDKHIKPIRSMCGKLRLQLKRWPARKGGRIPFKKVTK